ncbi:RNA polymerase subunit sigma [Bordetella genomosp. 10]|uniref:RNA polymerase subunit sigma n=1 Tax=Bordetella genomosp. 10 TaxID=1416804 RepID=A0A261SHR9_9BORD|nr:sigma-70 family RNA polymerase sigma factor [Bordetella genomosp. 10]OZI36936.1 RNA polymerase subunit sigma [Bordetella genomosp. 10]
MPISELNPLQQIETLYADHERWLLGWLRRKLGGAQDAADIAQDTFVRILATRDALVGIEEPRAYLTTIAKRLLVDRSRRAVVERTYLAEMARLAERLPTYPSPESVLMAVQALEQIGAAVEDMTAKVREAFLRHYLDGETHADIAASLGVSTRMVRKYLVQALLSFRARCPALAEHGA